MGHAHQVDISFKEQSEKLCAQSMWNLPQVELAENLPGDRMDKPFANSGAETIEGAIKLAQVLQHEIKTGFR